MTLTTQLEVSYFQSKRCDPRSIAMGILFFEFEVFVFMKKSLKINTIGDHLTFKPLAATCTVSNKLLSITLVERSQMFITVEKRGNNSRTAF